MQRSMIIRRDYCDHCVGEIDRLEDILDQAIERTGNVA